MKKIIHLLIIFSLAAIISCSESTTNSDTETPEETSTEVTKAEGRIEKINFMDDKGIGPINSVIFDETINEEMAKAGEVLYGQMCSACHKIDVNFIGPAQKGVLERRSPEWIMNMILNPQEMVEKNATAKSLLEEFNNVEMTDMGLTEEQARSVLEYFRTL
ncbi:MAG: cytochrome c [Cyclobacteriaceae bacterium]|nr:cytochrome c [Cyclobacteriaceae bacterium]